MRAHVFFILMALAEQHLHGSGIVREVLALTDGGLRLWPATLYGMLADLEAQGWIAELEDPDRPEGASRPSSDLPAAAGGPGGTACRGQAAGGRGGRGAASRGGDVSSGGG